MRLICPNCGAQYEVPADAIPPGGRDVQCSNCAHTWLEKPGASEAAEADASTDVVDAVGDAVGDAPQDDPSQEAGVTVAGGSEADSTDANDANQATPVPSEAPPPASSSAATLSAVASLVSGAAQDDVPKPPDAPAAAPRSSQSAEPQSTKSQSTAVQNAAAHSAGAKPAVRQGLSPSVSEILREEAAREEAARKAETGSEALGESQPDLNLDRPVDREEQLAEEARRRMARLKGQPSMPNSAPGTQTSGARSDLLPDIEEISSSLRSSADRAADAAHDPEPEVAQERQRRGFRFGFSIIVLIFALLALAYGFAPQISAAVPQAEPTLTSYVDAVDQGRLWIDLQLQSLLDGAAMATDDDTGTGADTGIESAPATAPDAPEAPATPETN